MDDVTARPGGGVVTFEDLQLRPDGRLDRSLVQVAETATGVFPAASAASITVVGAEAPYTATATAPGGAPGPPTRGRPPTSRRSRSTVLSTRPATDRVWPRPAGGGRCAPPSRRPVSAGRPSPGRRPGPACAPFCRRRCSSTTDPYGAR